MMRLVFLTVLSVFGLGAALVSATPLQDHLAQEDVRAALSRYVKALETKDKDKVMPLLNTRSVVMMMDKPSPPQAMAAEAAAIKSCGSPRVRVKLDHAVAYFSKDAPRTCSPYFLEREHGTWNIDLYYMAQVFRFDQNNHWIYERNVMHPYRFAFEKKKKQP